MHKILLAAGLAAAMTVTAVAPTTVSAHDHHWRHYHRYDSRYDHRGGCRHRNGTTGAVIGTVGGAAIGNSVSRGNRLPGTLLGAGIGALAGNAIGRSSC